MSEPPDHDAGYRLLEKVAFLAFDVVTESDESGPGGEVAHVELQLGEQGRDGERSEDHEWGAFGFIFCIAVLSFHDADAPLANGDGVRSADGFTIADLFDCLRYEHGCLRFRCETLRGRRLSTEVTVRPDGSVTIEARNRGARPARWLRLLRGRSAAD